MVGVVNPAGIPIDLTKWKASLPNAKGALADAQGNPTAYGAFVAEMFIVVSDVGSVLEFAQSKASLPNVKAALADLIADQNNIQANFNAIYQDPFAAKGALADAQGNPDRKSVV